ncbi:MAG: PKD domain-containing protein [Candidatus Hydrogenedentes bacterium]|nr:PKD domain-containing protein [Candidatus Hydrogenedentota bacterium]
MKRLCAIGLCLAAAWGPAPAWAAGMKEFGLSEAGAEPDRAPGKGAAEEAEWIEEQVRSLSLRERVAQLMLVSLEGGPRFNSNDRAFLERFVPGGVIIPEVLEPATAANYIVSLRTTKAVARSGIPLLIGTNLYDLPRSYIEQSRLWAPLPSMLTIAAGADREGTAQLAELLAAQLTTMGFNLHLGPSLELAPTIPGLKGSIHCFGSDPRFAAESGAVFVETFTEHGVLALPMGFPGGGANRARKGPAVLSTPRECLAERELLPFIRAVEAGAPLIHVGATLVPTLGALDEVACLSPVVISDLLRGELGFDGVVVAGPMDINDIAAKRDPTEAAILALQAGADMIYWREAGHRVLKTIDEVVQAVESGALSPGVIDSAFVRVLRLKLDHDLHTRDLPDPDAANRLARTASYVEEAYRLERRSITIVQNRQGVLPLGRRASLPLGVTGVVGVEALHDALEEYIKPVAQQSISSARHGGRILDFEVERIASRAEAARTIVFVLTPNLELDGALALLRALKAKGPRVVVVLAGYPDILPSLVEADAIVLAYCDPATPEQSMRAVADVLAGQGALAVDVPGADRHSHPGQPDRYDVLDIVRCPAGRLPVTIEPPFEAGLALAYDPATSIKKVAWDFGDGVSLKKSAVDKAFAEPGRYPVTLTVTDTKGYSASRTFYTIVD